jgi:hypothetical protein
VETGVPVGAHETPVRDEFRERAGPHRRGPISVGLRRRLLVLRLRQPLCQAPPLHASRALRRCYSVSSKSYRDATRAMTSGVSGADCAAMARSRM